MGYIMMQVSYKKITISVTEDYSRRRGHCEHKGKAYGGDSEYRKGLMFFLFGQN
jgi:hypothetical protein